MGGILDGETDVGGFMASSPAALYDSQRNKRNIEKKLNERGGKLIHNNKDDEMYINEIVTDDRSSGGSKYK